MTCKINKTDMCQAEVIDGCDVCKHNTQLESIDQILANLKKNPNAYNHGASSNGKEQEMQRFDRDD